MESYEELKERFEQVEPWRKGILEKNVEILDDIEEYSGYEAESSDISDSLPPMEVGQTVEALESFYDDNFRKRYEGSKIIWDLNQLRQHNLKELREMLERQNH